MARKILLADDSVTAQNMGRKILTDAGYEVITVNNGSAALKRVAEQKPDLIVLDVYMPGYSGLEVCQRLKDAPETSRIPILLTVGKLEPFKPEDSRRVGADSYIVKPFEASELLSALSRLEDRMVPHGNGPRVTNVYGIERFSGDDSGEEKTPAGDDLDTGWKSRLRFPSKKKQAEPEPEPESETDYGMNPFRDFRRGRGKSQDAGSRSAKAGEQRRSAKTTPDIPRDITPDELDALSAVAAKLDHAPESGDRTSAPDPGAASGIPTIPPKTRSAPEAEVASAEAISTTSSSGEVKAEPQTAALPELKVEPPPVTAPDAQALDLVAPQTPAAEMVQSGEETAPAAPEASSVASPEPVAAAIDAIPTQIDRNDEPLFSLAASAEPAAIAALAEAHERQDVPAIADSEVATGASADGVRTEAATTGNAPLQPPSDAAPVQAEDSPTEAEPMAVLETSRVEPAPAAEPAPEIAAEAAPAALEPTEEELAAALRLLTPAGQPGSSSLPPQEVLVAAGAVLAEAAAHQAASANRWVAEAVAVSPEEATMSLEAEMLRPRVPKAGTFSDSGQEAGTARSSLRETSGGDSVTIPPALAEAPAAAGESAVPTGGAEVPVEATIELAPVPEVAATAAEAIGGVEEGPQPDAAELPAPAVAPADPTPAGMHETAAPPRATEEKIESPGSPVDEPEEEPVAATFADAVQMAGAESGAAAEPSLIAAEVTVEPEAIPAEHDQNPVSTPDPNEGSEEPMAKNTTDHEKSKSGWHQIRSASAPARLDSVESAKQAEAAAAEEAPKAMAAAASGDDGSVAAPHAAAPAADAIANIVDSVLADLRPKIVEEIAKKLQGK